MNGHPFLDRWGLARPTDEQAAFAVTYLRRRRRLYPVAFAGMLLLIGGFRELFDAPGTRWPGSLLGAVIATLLVTELIAAIPRANAQPRFAILTPRRVVDLVPRSGLAVFAALLLAGLLTFAIALAARSWATTFNAWRSAHRDDLRTPDYSFFYAPLDAGLGPVLFAGASIVLTTLAVGVLLWLVVRRGPLTDDHAVDAALRIRTARVGVGTAMLLLSGLGLSLVASAQEMTPLSPTFLTGADLPPPLRGDFPVIPGWIASFAEWLGGFGMLVLLAGLIGWAALVNPWRRQRLVEANA